MSHARLVCVEGVDGAGKTTLVAGLERRLKQDGLNVGAMHLRSLFDLEFKRDLVAELPLELPLTDQELAFVSYSRLYDFYLSDIAPALRAHDLLLLDRYTWSYLVRWACRDVRWSVLSAVGAMTDMVPPADFTLLIDAEPFAAYQRKVSGGLALNRAETMGRGVAQGERAAFVNLQTRALGYYDVLFRGAAPATAARIDSNGGAAATLDQALALLRPLVGP